MHAITNSTILEVDLDAFGRNIRKLRSITPKWAAFLVVIKDNAFGLGAEALAPVALKHGANGFVVSRFSEAMDLRLAGISQTIINLGRPNHLTIRKIIQNGIVQVVGDPELADAIEQEARHLNKRAEVHISVDTGMARIGCNAEDVPRLVSHIAKLEHLHLTGIFTHFNRADTGYGRDESIAQRNFFYTLLPSIALYSPGLRWIHACNTAGLLQVGLGQLENMVRPGIGCYGYLGSPDVPNWQGLEPVARLVSHVCHVRKATPWMPVGYGATYYADNNEKLVTIQCGYGDGLDRRMSDLSHVGIRGQSCRIVGRVSMDFTVVLAAPYLTIDVGDRVSIFEGEGSPALSDLARRLGTIEHEILVQIPPRVPRVYLSEGKVDSICLFRPKLHSHSESLY